MSFSVPLILVTLIQASAVNESRDAVVTVLTRLEVEWNGAHVRGDATTLERLFADDLVVIVPGMRMLNKADSLGMFSAGRMKFTRYETTETSVRVYDAAAVITGRLRRTRMVAGKTADDDWQFTKMYIRRNERWQVVSFHASHMVP